MFLADLSPQIQVHLVCATFAVIVGPAALWVRKRTPPHRVLGIAWIAAMTVTAMSSFWIHSGKIPAVAGFSPIHMLSIATLLALGRGLWAITHGRVRQHRRIMQFTYIGLLIAGAFAFLPGRFLGDLL